MPKATPSRAPNRSSTPLRWGILGTGTIAGKFVRDLHASGVGQAAACGSRTIEGARTFAAAHGIPRVYGSYGELARDPDVEIVYVATPHALHFGDALACLKNKKSVLCEKPLVMNAAQAAKLFAAASDNGVYLMEALWTFFLPAVVKARQWIAEGAIGEVRLIEADFGFRSVPDIRSRLFNPALGGGALLDVGVYTVALAQWAAGNKTPRVKASARIGETGVDESTSILLDWHSGVRAHLSCSITQNLARPARIHGTRGTITLPKFWSAKKAILENDEGRLVFKDNRKTLGYDFEAAAVTADVRDGRRENTQVSEAFSLRLAATLDAVRKQIGLVYTADEV